MLIDGNHIYESVRRNFERNVQLANQESSIIAFCDIAFHDRYAGMKVVITLHGFDTCALRRLYRGRKVLSIGILLTQSDHS